MLFLQNRLNGTRCKPLFWHFTSKPLSGIVKSLKILINGQVPFKLRNETFYRFFG